MVSGALVVLPEVAAAAPQRTPDEQKWSSVSGKVLAPPAARKAAEPAAWKPPAVAWPAAGSGTVDLTVADAAAADALPARRLPGVVAQRAGALPVRVARAGAGPARVQVGLKDRAAAERAGVDGLLLEVRSTDAASAAGTVRVSVDPSGIAGGFGGDYAGRLRLIALPACALSTPDVAQCRTQTPVLTSRERDGFLSGVLPVPEVGKWETAAAGASVATVFALDAAPAGNSGDYSATSLKPSGSWSAGNSSGDFGYTYPIPLPPVPGALSPSVSLAYSAQSLDGKQVATNNQSSAIGDGWSYDPGSVERTYRSCSEDGVAPKASNDSCWAGPIVHVAFGAGSGDLVHDASLPTKWKLSTDDGARVELLGGADNGAHGGEHWKITTKDGTQYFFGLNKLPGWASGNATTNAAWTQRVYHPRSGDPCYKPTGFVNSWCDMAYKWNLDYVVDTRGNAYAYFYNTEVNYSVPYQASTSVSYVRGGYVDHIDYGLRAPNPYAAKASARVRFTNAERCVESASICQPGNIGANRTKWPDTPYDLNCNQGAACSNHAITFWSRIRTTGITTEVSNGTGYTQVDSYALTHSFPDPEDGTTPAMWLSQIQRTGGTGAGAITLPAVKFEPTRLPNRADGLDGAPAMNHLRISAITTESGQVIGIGYRTECAAPVTLDPATNTSLCYPVYWTKEGANDPTRDWFHKYVVTEVTDQDSTGRSPAMVTRYEYLGGGAWHLDDNELIKDKHRTYGQWKGYGRIRTRTGDGTDAKTLSETIYYRGMDGDKLPGGARRTATVTLSPDVPAPPGAAASVSDTAELAGSVRQTISYLGDGGPAMSSSVTDYWVSPALATRTRTGVDNLTSHMTRAVTTYSTSAVVSSATKTWRNTRSDTTHDTTTGLPTVVHDRGDVANPDDDTCTITGYAPTNTGANLIGLVADTETLALPCGGSGVNALTAPTAVSRPGDVIDKTRMIYDRTDFSTAWPQAPPTVGNITVKQQATDYKNGAYVWLTAARNEYDGHGRITKAIDAENAFATTAYTDTFGLQTQVVTKNALGHTTTTTFEPTRSLAVGTKDANNLESTLVYDALGRLTGMWRPGRDRNQGANLKYAYAISQTAPSTITTSTLNDDGSYRTTVAFYDAHLRPRQSQSPTPVGGRLVSDTFYDTHGQVVKTNDVYYDSSATPNTTMLDMVGHDQQIPTQHQYRFDGLGRAVAVDTLNKGVKKFETRTIYGGDRTTVIPPAGGTPSTTIVDALGRRTELASYSTMPAVNGTVVTGGNPVRITYGYDRRGNPNRTTDDKGNSWTSTFDMLGRTIATSDPDAGTSTMGYDDSGNLIWSKNQLGEKISTTYDLLGRKSAEYEGEPTGSPVATWTYDSTTITNGIGALATSRRWDDGAEYKTDVTGYNSWGSTLGVTVTIPATTANGNLAGTYAFTNTYTATSGLLQKTVYPNKGGLPAETVNHTYTATDLPSGVGSSLGNYVDHTRYNPYAQVSQTKFGFGTTNVAWRTNIYDEFTKRIANTYVDRSGTGTTRTDDVTYQYNDSGQMLSTTNTRNGNTSSETQCYRYDLLGRLTTAWTATDACTADLSTVNSNATVGGISPYWHSWTYNTIGDRTREIRHAVPGSGGVEVTADYTYPTNGTQPHTLQGVAETSSAGTNASTFQYDPLGRNSTRRSPQGQTQTLTWDRSDRLTKVATGGTTSATYVYDADGNLLIQRNPSASTATLYLPGQELTLQTLSSTVTGRRYYTAPDGTQCVRTGSTATAYSYLMSDPLGTATLTLDRNGTNPQWRSITPFGTPRGTPPTTWPDTHAYLGKPTDSTTGLVILGARHYDPVVGRFISVDPLLATDDLNQLGGYAYSGDDPVNTSDPSGLQGSASCAPGYVGGPGACTGNENAPGSGKPEDYCWSATTRCDMPGWSPPPPKVTPPSKKKKKNNCWVCKAWDASVDWAQNHSELVGMAVGIAVGVAVGAICTGATFGGGAVACAAIGGAIGGAVAGAVTHGLDVSAGRADGSSVGGWLGAIGVGAVVGAVSGAVAAVAGAAALGGALALASGAGAKAAGKAAVAGVKAAVSKGGSGAAGASGAADDAARAGGRGPSCKAPGNSFVAGTLVLLSDGSRKPIEQIVVGDLVVATDPETGRTDAKPVTATIIGEGLKTLVELVIDEDGAAGAGEATVIATGGHPFWSVEHQDWLAAIDISAGDHLLTADGRVVEVLRQRSWTETERVHNLTVADTHTYYVVADNVSALVHNCGGGKEGHADDCECATGGPKKFDPDYFKQLPSRTNPADTTGRTRTPHKPYNPSEWSKDPSDGLPPAASAGRWARFKYRAGQIWRAADKLGDWF